MSDKPYKPEWFNKYRRVATKISKDIQRRKTEPKVFRDKVKEREELRKQSEIISARLRELRQEIFEECPHKVKHHELHESGRYDDYGRYQGGTDSVIKCACCEEEIVRWGASENFFGVDKNGKSGYGPSLEYFEKRAGSIEKYRFDKAEYIDG